MFDSYEVGARCWVPSKTAGWASARVEAKTVKSDVECVVEVSVQGPDGGLLAETAGGDAAQTTQTVTIRADPAPELPLRNPPALEATADLVTLSYLNEPSVLHAIRERYSHLQIYTFSGIVLIATNPFDRVDNLYTSEVVQMYSGRQRGELEPHLFSIAEDALRCMQRDNKNQTIVVSGESGAGKTMSAKYIMRYFATVEDPAKKRAALAAVEDGGLSRTEREILATNPIMEAFGNAKTTRNDNSSRFGKYLEIRFDSHLEISGARIRTYLLERSRIVFHPPTERNYHIFYQLLRGLPEAELARLGLAGGIKEFHYVNQGDSRIAGIDDAREFAETQQALDVVGISAELQWRVFEVLAALLHLGNVELKGTSRGVLVSTDDSALLKCAELLGIPPAELAKWLTNKQIQVRSQAIQSDLDAKTSLVVRDSIAKYVYSALFDWLVGAVNVKLFGGNENDRFIGVLDIYGFEHFKTNSFEQFCINYANEKLQQEFNQHVFKLEQAEYETEEIDWTYIDFVDNQPCITLIEAKMGVLGLLDEESRLPAGSDEGFTQKLYGTLDGKPHFRKPRLGQSSFIVAHYAHDVEYETEGFIEKNRDTVPETVIEMLGGTTNPFLTEILQSQTAEPATDPAAPAKESAVAAPRRGGAGSAVKRRPTLGNMFKTSLIELMDTISSTNAHYIRCIKPNEQKEAWAFDGPMVLSQLRACGVLETIRISSMGFPGRWPYAEFVNRYDLLLHSSIRDTKSVKEICLAVLESHDDPTTKRKSYALGKTKVFLAAGMLAQLENRRTKRHVDAAVAIQRRFKMQVARAEYRRTLAFIADLKALARGRLARKRADQQRAEDLAVALQSLARRRVQVLRLHTVQTAVLGIQAAVRLRQAQVHAEEDRKHQAAVSVQTLVRAYQARQTHQRQVYALTIVQSMVRRRGARRQLQKLKEEQHSVKHFEEKQYRMENKVIELQNSLTAQREDAKSLLERVTLAEAARETAARDLAAATDSHSAQHETMSQRVSELTQTVEERTAEIKELQSELETRNKQVEQLRDTLAEQEQFGQQLQLENGDLRQRNTQLEHSLAQAQAAQIGTGAVASYHHRQQVTADLAAHAGGGAGAGASPQQRMLMEYDYSEELQRLNDQVEKALREPMGAKEELLTKLIRSLEVPVPPMKSNVKPTENIPERDVLYPANITNLIVSEMWRFGMIEESEKTIGAILRTIQETVQKTTGERMIDVGPWWLANVHEIYSFLSLAESNISQNIHLQDQMTPLEIHQYSTLTRLAKDDATNVLFNIYHMYMKELKKIFDKLVVPAVIEEQSIPGFKTEASSGGLFSGFFVQSHPATMDDLILMLSKVLSALEGFYLEDHYIKQPLKELMTLIGARAFNDMVMRTKFLTWKRAVQINYNVTRIDEWCKASNFQEGGIPLEPITQAAKLLQLKKTYEQDVTIIYDICWSLTPTQIQRLIANYQAADYELPVTQGTHQMIARRIKEDKNASTRLLMDLRPLADSGPFELAAPRTLEKLEPYIPAKLAVPKLRELTELTTESSRLQDQVPYYDDAQDGGPLGIEDGELGPAPGAIELDPSEGETLREAEAIPQPS